MTRQVSAWQRGHPLSWAQRSWGPSIVLSTHSLTLSSSSPSLTPSLYLNPLRNHRLPPSRSYPGRQSLSLVLLLPISVPPLLPPSPLLLLPFPPWTLCYWLELCEEINRDPAPRTSSHAVEEDKGTHPDVPFALLPAPYDTYSRISLRGSGVGATNAYFVRKMRRST